MKAAPSVWEFMLGVRSAYRGDFQLLHNVSAVSLSLSFSSTYFLVQDFINGVIRPRRPEDVALDKRILRQCQRWEDVMSGRLRREEWARGMVLATMEI